jgi:hypothetical protein
MQSIVMFNKRQRDIGPVALAGRDSPLYFGGGIHVPAIVRAGVLWLNHCVTRDNAEQQLTRDRSPFPQATRLKTVSLV